MLSSFIYPNWPAHPRVKACSTVRAGGVSSAPYASFNLAMHVNDDAVKVKQNREKLYRAIDQPQVAWLNQAHSCSVVSAEHIGVDPADACYTAMSAHVCAVMTADCLPVLLCNQSGTWVAAVHAGWRGLLQNIISKTLKHACCSTDSIMAWLGPAISKKNYCLPKSHVAKFLAVNQDYSSCFEMGDKGMFAVDLYQLARVELERQGVKHIYGGNYCTYEHNDLFFSYRRDGALTGRMASMIWLL